MNGFSYPYLKLLSSYYLGEELKAMKESEYR